MSHPTDEFTHERLLEWALRLEAEGADSGAHLAQYAEAWREEGAQLRAAVRVVLPMLEIAGFAPEARCLRSLLGTKVKER